MRATIYQKNQAVNLLEEGKITEVVAGILYQVPSATREGKSYFVYYGTPRACNCDGYYWQGAKGIKFPVCSHIKAVGLYRGNIQ